MLFFTKRSLASNDVNARLKAVDSLVSSRSHEITALLSGALLKALNNLDANGYQKNEKNEIEKIIWALGTTGDPSVVDVLGKALREVKRYTVKIAAASALSKLSVPASVEPLLDALILLDDRGSSLTIKGDIAITLARIGDRRAIAPLKDFRDRLNKEYDYQSKNPPSDPTPLARKDYEEDLAYIVNCGSVVTKALTTFK